MDRRTANAMVGSDDTLTHQSTRQYLSIFRHALPQGQLKVKHSLCMLLARYAPGVQRAVAALLCHGRLSTSSLPKISRHSAGSDGTPSEITWILRDKRDGGYPLAIDAALLPLEMLLQAIADNSVHFIGGRSH